MREDMSRLIVERPRKGGNFGRKGRAVALENLPTKVGMRRFHVETGSYKYLNENLAPLRRYLERQVGRPWNKVFSEIAAHIRVDSTVQQHVRQHLQDFVAINPRHEINKGWYRYLDRPWRQPLYVDPDDGLLKRTDRLLEVRLARRKRSEKAAEPVNVMTLPDGREVRQINGAWYEVWWSELPEARYETLGGGGSEIRVLLSPLFYDVISCAEIAPGPVTDDAESWATYRRNHPDRRYAAKKRALSSAELKRHGLKNEMPAS